MGHTQNTARKSFYLAGQLLLKPWRNKKPRTHVLRLLLTPDNIYKRRNFISVQQVNVYTTYYTHKNTQYVCVCAHTYTYHTCYLYMYIYAAAAAKSLQSCPTLCDPMDCSLPGSIHGIFQARILEWVAISFSRGSS